MATRSASKKKSATMSGSKVAKASPKKKSAVKKAPAAKKSVAKSKKSLALMLPGNPLVRFDVHCFHEVPGPVPNTMIEVHLEGVHVAAFKYGDSTPVDSKVTDKKGRAQLTVPRYNTYSIVAELKGFDSVSIGTPEIKPGMDFSMPMHERSDEPGKVSITVTFNVYSGNGPIQDATCTFAQQGLTAKIGLSASNGKCPLTGQSDHMSDLTAAKAGYTSYSYHTYLDRHDDGWTPTFPLCPI